MKAKEMLKNQDGFTLIEIIAVLVILGIMAAVAVPKYLNLTDEARQKAVEGALAAGASEITMNYAKAMLTPVTTDDALSVVVNACETSLGDFTAEYAVLATNDGISVTITAPSTLLTNVTTVSKSVFLF